MEVESFPALFRGADAASNRHQSRYLLAIKVEYTLLVFASAISLVFVKSQNGAIAFSIVLILAIAVLFYRTLSKPEQDWYECRALAESIKSMTWRYVMKSEPFLNDNARETFRDHLQELFSVNKSIAKKIDPTWLEGDQITDQMDRVRSFNLEGRLNHYSSSRVADQRTWYANKARWNWKRSIIWSALVALAYASACVLSILRIKYSEFGFWPVDPAVVIASSLIGWTQIKKYSELATAYKVPASEIGLIIPKMNAVGDDEALSEFVSKAESAFSREHTMWVARQTS